jgi:hypothetical protein
MLPDGRLEILTVCSNLVNGARKFELEAPLR